MSSRKPRRFLGAKITSTISIALVLFVLGLLVVGILAATRVAQSLREQFTVSITVVGNAPVGYGEQLVKRLEAQPYTAEAVYISADSALQVVSEELGENPQEFLGFNPLSPTVELRLKSEYAVTDSIEPIVERLQAAEGARIEHIDYSRVLVDMVNANVRRYALILLSLALVLLLISVSLISNTVRLSLHADRFLINTMRLVGATGWFIRKPFIRTHAICGLIAAVIAMGGLVAFLYGVGMPEMMEEIMVQPLSLAILVLTLVIAGLLIPGIAAWIACSKYLRRSEDELYLM